MQKIKYLVLFTQLFCFPLKAWSIPEREWVSAASPKSESRPTELQKSSSTLTKGQAALCVNSKEKGKHTVCSIFGKDERVEIDYKYFGEKWVVCLNPSEGSCNCSGALIDEEHVLTAAHCVTDRNKKTNVVKIDPMPSVGFGHTEKGDDEILQVTKMWISPDYLTKGHWEKDWAILKLEKKAKVEGHFILSNVRYAQWLNNGAKSSESKGNSVPFPVKINHAGFGYNFLDGKKGGVQYNCAYRNLGEYSGILLHDCDMGKGSSGGPMWIPVNRINPPGSKNPTERFALIVGINFAERSAKEGTERDEIYDAMPENKKDPLYLEGKEHSLIYPAYSERFGNLAYDTVHVERAWEEIKTGKLSADKSSEVDSKPFVVIPPPQDLGIELKVLPPPKIEKVEVETSFLPTLKTVSMLVMNKDAKSRVGYNVHPPEDLQSSAYKTYIQKTLLTERGNLFQLALDTKGKLWTTQKSSDPLIPHIYEKITLVADWSYSQLIVAPFGPGTDATGETYNFYLLNEQGQLCYYEFKQSKDGKKLMWKVLHVLNSSGPGGAELKFVSLEVDRERELFIGKAESGKRYSWNKGSWIVFNP